MDKQAGIGIKDRYLTLIFKSVLLELSEVETHSNDRRTENRTKNGQKIAQTYGHSVLNIGIWCHTFQTKKKEF